MHSVKRNSLLLLCCCVAAVLVRALPAPEYDQVAGNEVEGNPKSSTGIYAEDAAKHMIGGSTKLKAQVYAGVDLHFETNVLLRSTNEEDSLVWAAIAGGRLVYEGQQFNGSLLGQLNAKAFSGFSELNGVTGHLDLRADYSINESNQLSFSDLFEYAQDPVDIAQDSRSERVDNTLTGIFDRKFAAGGLRAGVVNSILDYTEDRFRYLDYISLKGFAEGSFDVPLNQEKLGLKETRAFLRLSAEKVTHQHVGLNDPFFFEVLAGLRGMWQTRFTWDAAVGIDAISVDEEVNNPADEDQEIAFAYAAELQYQAGERSVITLASSRRAEASINSNYAKATRVSLGVVHFFNERLNAEAVAGYQYMQRSINGGNISRTSALVRANYMFKPTESLPLFRVYGDASYVARDGDQ